MGQDEDDDAGPAGFEAREGDVLVVSYPEVTVPVVQYSAVKVGGLIYTRRIQKGDDPNEQYEKIYAWLKRKAEKAANEKVADWSKQLRGARS